MERAGALQHRPGRLRQAPARQAGDDLGALRRRAARPHVGRAAGPVQPGRELAGRPWRRPRGPRRGGASTDARDGCDLLRHVEARRDPPVDVGALRRRRHPPPADRLPGEGPRHRRAERAALRPVVGRERDPRPRRRHAARPVDRLRDRRHLRRGSGPALLHVRHDRRRQGRRPRPPLHPRPRGVRLLPRRAGRREVPRHGRVGLGRGRRAAARAVALRRAAVRLPARGRLRPGQAAGLPQPPRGHERLHDARPRCGR